jgi:hypothetical protein
MEGFYKKTEAAQILGVSTRQINNYFTEGKLRRVYQGRYVWIPQADVDGLYAKSTHGLPFSNEDFESVQERVSKLEADINVLKLGLGFGAPRRPRSDTDLLLLRQEFLGDLGKSQWSKRRMSQISDELMSLQDVEVASLCDLVGPEAWVPLCDLASRMMLFIETREEYPGRGLDALMARLLRARDRFYGLIYAATKSSTAIGAQNASSMLKRINEAPNRLERHILSYIRRLSE